MEPSLRIFIAIELSDEVKHLIAKLQKNLQETDADVKWVLPDICHITLKFLGNIAPSQLEPIKNIMEECAAATRSFALTLEGVGSFPTGKRPEIIWVGIKEDSQLTALAAALEKKLFNIGFQKENRPFNAHATIGRVKSSRSAQLIADQLASASFTAQIIEVSRLTLFQSQLSTDGPIYAALHRSPLK